ncbi:hypothetical protein IE077_004429 [Cardiosporidium cionae]|uniref:Uncharacterized protein n=1 Tax=Cardiosporidium cionae TaxID=476202 RepID=A0ABQ7JA09_9APIC|nr:hypothetical protein IE077_004429 [Cardiosporidium cionae]|eukprot:KAF8820804.1 hypothetical protein IE077_004429 [Cardiosporidium cionae]
MWTDSILHTVNVPRTIISNPWKILMGSRWVHKFAAPPCPNLLNLRRVVYQKLQPICFHVRNDLTMGNHVWDTHFYVSLKII